MKPLRLLAILTACVFGVGCSDNNALVYPRMTHDVGTPTGATVVSQERLSDKDLMLSDMSKRFLLSYARRLCDGEAAESLDRMIETSEAMLENMKLMNHNLEMIFRAVTNCSTDQECAAEHARLQEQIDARAK